MTMLSYAQNREDVVLARAFEGRTGFYVDVGAASPVINSVTKHFYDHGWRGINIEPLSVWHEELERERPRDINLAIGLGDVEGVRTFYDVSEDALEESTFSPDVAERLRARGFEPKPREMPLSTLAAVCAEHAPATIDFLKIDVEGFELPVLQGADWGRFRPAVVVIESTHDGDGSEVRELMGTAGYAPALFDGINRFYVEADDEELRERLRAPANALDDFQDAAVADLESAVRTLIDQRERERVASDRRVQELDARVRELERGANALRQRADSLQGRLEFAERDVAAARRSAADAELQFRTTREALERLLDA